MDTFCLGLNVEENSVECHESVTNILRGGVEEWISVGRYFELCKVGMGLLDGIWVRIQCHGLRRVEHGETE